MFAFVLECSAVSSTYTACLTTPIETSMMWAQRNSSVLLPHITRDMINNVPGPNAECCLCMIYIKLTAGQIQDRRTMRGQLNWIFTAITDTIAWNTFSPDVFHKFFRNDLLVAAVYRNFLLAVCGAKPQCRQNDDPCLQERIMRSMNCTPVASPPLPPTHRHQLWEVRSLN